MWGRWICEMGKSEVSLVLGVGNFFLINLFILILQGSDRLLNVRWDWEGQRVSFISECLLVPQKKLGLLYIHQHLSPQRDLWLLFLFFFFFFEKFFFLPVKVIWAALKSSIGNLWATVFLSPLHPHPHQTHSSAQSNTIE